MRAAPVAAIGAAWLLTLGQKHIPATIKEQLSKADPVGWGIGTEAIALGAWGVWSLLKGGK